MERKLEVTLERKDYIALFVLLMNKKLMLLAAIPLMIAIPVGAALIGYIGSQASVSLWALLLPYAALAVVFVLIFLRALIAPALRQFKEAQKLFGNKFTFLLNSEGFICHGGYADEADDSRKAEYAYAHLDRALENKDYIFFFVNGGQACIFPKRQMNELDLAFLKKILPKCAIVQPEELGELLGADAKPPDTQNRPKEPLS